VNGSWHFHDCDVVVTRGYAPQREGRSMHKYAQLSAHVNA
jgi:hypothetical protein